MHRKEKDKSEIFTRFHTESYIIEYIFRQFTLLILLDGEESIKDFIDDLCILKSSNSSRELEIKANTDVIIIHNWCQR